MPFATKWLEFEQFKVSGLNSPHTFCHYQNLWCHWSRLHQNPSGNSSRSGWKSMTISFRERMKSIVHKSKSFENMMPWSFGHDDSLMIHVSKISWIYLLQNLSPEFPSRVAWPSKLMTLWIVIQWKPSQAFSRFGRNSLMIIFSSESN
jgi:hypothetical protein